MGKKEYKYDVAFSFLKDDEGLAQELNDSLKDKIRTFIYTKNQKEIAGKDGEETFNKVFGEEARVVVVLYRKGWGNSPWTRIEETAIKNRAFDEGYEFTLFIPLNQPPKVPEYLPKTYVWYGIHKFGIKVVLSIIESKIQSQDGIVREELPEDIAKRINEGQKFEEERKKFLESVEGVEAARREVKKLYGLLKEKKENINKEFNDLCGYEEKDNECYINSYGHILQFCWHPGYQTSLYNSYLKISLQKLSDFSSQAPETLKELKFNFDILINNEKIWVDETDRNKYYSSEQLVDNSFNILFRHIETENKAEKLRRYL